MSHEIEKKSDGTYSMFYCGEVPWHGLGQKLDSPPTAAEAIKMAGLDWSVSVHPMETWLEIDGQDVCIPARTKMVIRNSDHKRLSEVGPAWAPLQNKDAFAWFDPFIQSGECSFETAGSLFGGERIWVLAKLNREPLRIVGDDIVDKYVMLSNNHSDKRSARVALTAQRVVCFNTLCMAFANKTTKFLSVKHTTKIKDNLLSIREIVNTANAEFEATAEQYRALTKLQVGTELLKRYVKLVFKPEKDEEELAPPKKNIKEDDARLIENKIIPLFEEGKGANLPGVRGTMWSAYNAVTEFLTWHVGRTIDARLDSLWFGQNQQTNRRALEVALEMVKSSS